MKVTIAIPHFRSEASLGFLLQSLSKQKTRLKKEEVEIIIVNDEQKIIPGLNNFSGKLNIKILNQDHQGPAVARNTALKSASGELIFYLDSDSIPETDWFETLYLSFLKNYKSDVIGGKVIPLKQGGYVNDYFNLVNDLGGPKINKENGEIISVITANCGFRTEKLRAIGGFNEKAFRFVCPGGEDMDVSYRLKKNNCHFVYESEAIVKHIYPQRISSLIIKYRNYGVGLRRHIEFNNINSVDIHQSSLNFISFILYFFNMLSELYAFIKKFLSSQSISRILLYSFFFIIKYIAFGYGYFIKGKYNPKFNHEAKD